MVVAAIELAMLTRAQTLFGIERIIWNTVIVIIIIMLCFRIRESVCAFHCIKFIGG